MEMTDDILKRIANHIVDLRNRISVLESLVVENSDGDYLRVDRMIKEGREKPGYQTMCDQIFLQLRDGD